VLNDVTKTWSLENRSGETRQGGSNALAGRYSL
jgi:hypothetical protein